MQQIDFYHGDPAEFVTEDGTAKSLEFSSYGKMEWDIENQLAQDSILRCQDEMMAAHAVDVWDRWRISSVLKQMQLADPYAKWDYYDLIDHIKALHGVDLDHVDEYGTLFFGLHPDYKTENGIDGKQLVHRDLGEVLHGPW